MKKFNILLPEGNPELRKLVQRRALELGYGTELTPLVSEHDIVHLIFTYDGNVLGSKFCDNINEKLLGHNSMSLTRFFDLTTNDVNPETKQRTFNMLVPKPTIKLRIVTEDRVGRPFKQGIYLGQNVMQDVGNGMRQGIPICKFGQLQIQRTKGDTDYWETVEVKVT